MTLALTNQQKIYWQAGIKEKSPNKSQIMTLNFVKDFNNLSIATLPIKDSTTLLWGFAKIINKTLQYSLIEVTKLIELVSNPNQTIKEKKKRTIKIESPLKQEKLFDFFEITQAEPLPIDDIPFERTSPEMPQRHTPPGIEACLNELGETINTQNLTDKIRKVDTTPSQKLFTPISNLPSAGKASVGGFVDTPNDVARELFANDENEIPDVKPKKLTSVAVLDSKITALSKHKKIQWESILTTYESNLFTKALINQLIKIKKEPYACLLNDILECNIAKNYDVTSELSETVKKQEAPEFDVPNNTYDIPFEDGVKASISVKNAIGTTNIIMISQSECSV